jgi:hypothetical protein
LIQINRIAPEAVVANARMKSSGVPGRAAAGGCHGLFMNQCRAFPDCACTQPVLPSDMGDLVRRQVYDDRDGGRRAFMRARPSP